MLRTDYPKSKFVESQCRGYCLSQYPSRRSRRIHKIYWSWFQWRVHSGSNVEGTWHSLDHVEPGADPPAWPQRWLLSLPRGGNVHPFGHAVPSQLTPPCGCISPVIPQTRQSQLASIGAPLIHQEEEDNSNNPQTQNSTSGRYVWYPLGDTFFRVTSRSWRQLDIAWRE
jgi:hypothetical protein